MKAVGEAALRRLIAERVAAWNDMSVGSVPMDRPLADLGMSSRDAVALAGEFSYVLGRELPSTLLWETPTGDALVARLCGGAEEAAPVPVDDRSAPGRPGEPYEPVAVVGVGCRLPGAVRGPADYWRLLSEGTDAIRRVPEDRWRDFTPFPPADVPAYGGYLDDIAGFDADFFHITPREAAVMDPQQRILLEVVHEALAHAAVPAASLAGTATGVFVGISAPEYGQLTGADPTAVDPWAPAGAALSVAAGRLAYVLDTRGPSMAVDTACSSSLVAVHHACVSLRTGESDTAIAAGVNLLLSPAVTVAFQRAGALAPDGRCKPFSAAADGIGRGEGCAAVLLKRLSDAERDGDRVLAVIRATAVNSDGRSGGLMAPNPAAQRAVLSTAYARAGLAAASVDYVEAHGTGTPLGDPIEAGALDAVLGRGRDPDQPLLVGSAKGNLGHLESAAGLAGLVKTVLALHHDRIPPSLHCADGSTLGDSRLRVVTETEPWPRYGGTATAGVSGFGFGGTNAHAVLEEWRPGALVPDAGGDPVAHLFPLSDVDAERVRDTAARLSDWLHTPDGGTARLADMARTLAGRTGRGRARAAVTARDRAELADALGALARQRPHARVVTGERELVGRGPVWVFSGYGSQWAGMGRRLLAEEPAFAAAVEKLDPQLAAECGLSLYDHLATGADLDRLEVAQPVLFGLQVALAELWRSRGVEPVAVIGHSLGEVAAAVCAGALDVPDAARIVAVRARLLSGLSGGAMAVADVPDDELDGLRRDFPGVHVAVHSSPRQKVVTGQEPEVAAFVRWLEERGRAARVMRVVGAGHSPQVDALLPELTEALAGLRGRPPRVPVYSTVLDDPRGESRFDAAHWAANLRRPVRLDRAVAAAAEDGHSAFVEISPHPVLGQAVVDTVADALVVSTLRRGADDSAAFTAQLGTLYTAGLRLPVPSGRVIDVPAPRWRHVRHWWTDGVRDRRTEPTGTPPPPARITPKSDPGSGSGSVVERLRHHVAAVTGHPSARITPGTVWADLGLDSLMAVRIRAAVQCEFGIELSLRDLLASPTVAETADRIRRVLPSPATSPTAASVASSATASDSASDSLSDAASDAASASLSAPASATASAPASDSASLSASVTDAGSPLRVLRGIGSRPPLFLFHAAGGSTDVYRRLTERLGDDRPVFGLERQEETGTVADKARRCAEAISAAHPDGPCLLGGWSFGGFVAQETARQLTAAGRDVDLVVLIDSVRPLPRPGHTPADRIRAHLTGFARHVGDTYGVPLELPYDDLVALDDDGERIDAVLRAVREVADVPSAALEHQRSSYLDLRIGEAHRPGRYDGRVVLYRALGAAPHTVRDPAYEREDKALGWDEVCPRLEVVPVAGHHLSLLDPPHVDEIAVHLRRVLAEPTR